MADELCSGLLRFGLVGPELYKNRYALYAEHNGPR